MGVPGLMPPNKHNLDQNNYYLTYSDAAENFLNNAWSTTPSILYNAANINPADIDFLIPHQVLKKRIEFISEAATIPLNKTINILSDYANCGSATILVALDHARKKDQLKKNQTALLVAAGGAFHGVD